MTENFLNEIRSLPNLSNAIINSVTLERESNRVTVKLLTDKAFSAGEKEQATCVARKYIPEYFDFEVAISKLTPDEDMVRRKIREAIKENFKTLYVTVREEDIKVEKKDAGYSYTVSVMPAISVNGICDKITDRKSVV